MRLAEATGESWGFWAPDRTAALQRLKDVLPKLGREYASARNYDRSGQGHSSVSALSPWVRHGLISEAEILQAALGRHSAQAAEKFVQEVVWRGYFKGWLEQRPGVWDDYRAGLTRDLRTLERDRALRAEYEAAVEGRAGIACFDAWASQLETTGYLHNHARMWFASIWIFTLGLPWRLGADLFYRRLLDGDPASNTLSWRWTAGLHTRGKHYLARASNIATYTDGAFNPAGQLNETAEPMEEEDFSLAVMPELPLAAPMHGRTGLVLTPDTYVERVPADLAAAIGVLAPQARSPLQVAPLVEAFEGEALEQRLLALPPQQTVLVEPDTAVETAATIADWARAEQLETVILPWIATGPYAELTVGVAAKLSQAGLHIARTSRGYDRLIWPHARGGFFKVKKQIPGVLEAMGLG
jgi:deoxyribodipyrimidine photo-lyase